MSVSLILLVVAIVLFVLAALGVTLGTVALIPLAEQVAAELPTTLDRVESLEAWRNRIAGAVVVLSMVVVPLAVEVARNHVL